MAGAQSEGKAGVWGPSQQQMKTRPVANRRGWGIGPVILTSYTPLASGAGELILEAGSRPGRRGWVCACNKLEQWERGLESKEPPQVVTKKSVRVMGDGGGRRCTTPLSHNAQRA